MKNLKPKLCEFQHIETLYKRVHASLTSESIDSLELELPR